MNPAKLLPIQGWVFLAILAGGSYFGYSTYTSFIETRRIPTEFGTSNGAAAPADDLAIARALLTDPADRQALDSLSMAISSAQPSELPALRAQAAAMRLSAETACIMVVGKTPSGGLELLSRNGGLVRPAVRCVAASRSGELVAIQGLAPSPPWVLLSELQALPQINGKSWVQVGEKALGTLSPVWTLKVSR